MAGIARGGDTGEEGVGGEDDVVVEELGMVGIWGEEVVLCGSTGTRSSNPKST